MNTERLPSRPRPTGRLSIAMLLSGMLLSSCGPSRPPDRYLIPAGYVGWVRIDFRVKPAPPLPQAEGYRVFQIPIGGWLKTSSPLYVGVARDEYYYVAPGGRTPLAETGWGGGGMIWGDATGATDEEFFVGTEQEFQKLNGFSRVGPINHSIPRMKGRDLWYAQLAHHNLAGANFRGAILNRANLKGANLRFANLADASLESADLTRANLSGADLECADLLWAYLVGADLRHADLQGTELEVADLRHASLKGAQLRGAHYDRYTRWPSGFDPTGHGAVLVAEQPVGPWDEPSL